jgi:serine/threonine protein kinase
MEYLEGETLASRLENGPLPLDQALTFASEMADALAAAHRVGIVHRDLKPSNIILTRTGAKLLDFGLAKPAALTVAHGSSLTRSTTPPSLTARGTIVGTLQYMAPEQLEGKDADARTDIFAFGAVVYEMLTGKKAFEGKSQASLIGAIMHAQPAPIAVSQPLTPPALDRIVRTCLAKDPDDRWQSARSVTRVAMDQPRCRRCGRRAEEKWSTRLGRANAPWRACRGDGRGGPRNSSRLSRAAFLRVLNALENIRSSINVAERGRKMSSAEDKRELAGLTLAETVDAVQVLSEGALATDIEPSIRLARVKLLDARMALEVARHLPVPHAIDNLLDVAIGQLRAARSALADPASLPPSFQN